MSLSSARTHDSLNALHAIAALEAGKHVLVEKPAGRNPQELDRLIPRRQQLRKESCASDSTTVSIPDFLKAKEIMTAGGIGPLMFIRARYGHGGRLGYEKEWRADPKISGGGELLDQGVHLIDLCRWLGGEWQLKWGEAKTFFWPMEVEDNGFLLLESADRSRSAFLHASCTEWKNLFDFEIFGKTGKLEIWEFRAQLWNGRTSLLPYEAGDGSAGNSRHGLSEDDTSWKAEFEAFVQELTGKKTAIATAEDALCAVEHRLSDVRPKWRSCSTNKFMQCVILAGGLGNQNAKPRGEFAEIAFAREQPPVSLLSARLDGQAGYQGCRALRRPWRRPNQALCRRRPNVGNHDPVRE